MERVIYSDTKRRKIGKAETEILGIGLTTY